MGMTTIITPPPVPRPFIFRGKIYYPRPMDTLDELAVIDLVQRVGAAVETEGITPDALRGQLASLHADIAAFAYRRCRPYGLSRLAWWAIPNPFRPVYPTEFLSLLDACVGGLRERVSAGASVPGGRAVPDGGEAERTEGCRRPVGRDRPDHSAAHARCHQAAEGVDAEGG
jgi:hypothetical protein